MFSSLWLMVWSSAFLLLLLLKHFILNFHQMAHYKWVNHNLTHLRAYTHSHKYACSLADSTCSAIWLNHTDVISSFIWFSCAKETFLISYRFTIKYKFLYIFNLLLVHFKWPSLTICLHTFYFSSSSSAGFSLCLTRVCSALLYIRLHNLSKLYLYLKPIRRAWSFQSWLSVVVK